MKRSAQKTERPQSRDDDLRDLLENRRKEILEQVQHGIRHVRAHHGRGSLNEVRDSVESSDALLQEDLDLALLQLKTETLEKVEDALARLDECSYGYCFECGGEISRQRLVSLPFAVRCTRCEEALETAVRAEKPAARRDAPSPDAAP
jgi:DnaK suppressor protein